MRCLPGPCPAPGQVTAQSKSHVRTELTGVTLQVSTISCNQFGKLLESKLFLGPETDHLAYHTRAV